MDESQLRPRTVGEVLDDGARLAFAHWRTLVPIVACVIVPLQILDAIVLAATIRHGAPVPGNLFALHLHTVREPDGRVRVVGEHTTPFGVLAAEYVLASLGQLLVTAACVRALGDVLAGAQPSARAALSQMARRLPALVALYVVRWLLIILGLILFIVPGVWLAGAWSVAVPACVLEGAGVERSLDRSFGLVRHRWWPVFAVIIVADIAVGILAVAVQTLFAGIDGFSTHPVPALGIAAVTLGAIAVALLTEPVLAAIHAVLYLDLRIRRGGDELAALAHQLGLSAPEPAVEAASSPVEPIEPDAGERPPYWPPPPGWRPRS